MLGLSLFLLGMASWQTLIIFLLVTQVAFFLCRVSTCFSLFGRKVVLSCLIPLLLAPLLYYKYGYFIGANLFASDWDTLRDLVIPIGISFYTFQVIAFCIDTLMRGQELPSWVDYMNFSSYFPQIVAGPIERREQLLPQVQRMELKWTVDNLNIGSRYIVLGLFFKMALAEAMAFCFFKGYPGRNAGVIWLNNLLFAFRIYFDFAGYGLIAFGLARCMGIELRMNFMSPYTACNVSDFWRRWHISLTQWFRDYIYFPLGGSRTRLWALNIVLMFLISGLWHGANWNFVLWGGIAGVAMVLHRVWRRRGWKLWAPLAWGLTFGMAVFTWMFFYDSDWSALERHLTVVFNPSAYDLPGFKAELMSKFRAMSTVVAAPYLLLSFIVILGEALSFRLRGDPYALFLSDAFCFFMVWMIVMTNMGVSNQFIYFAF